jgi:hypothetical protein
MLINPQKTAQLGELVAAVFDEATLYSNDPREVSRLATRTVARMLRHGRRATLSRRLPPLRNGGGR